MKLVWMLLFKNYYCSATYSPIITGKTLPF